MAERLKRHIMFEFERAANRMLGRLVEHEAALKEIPLPKDEEDKIKIPNPWSESVRLRGKIDEVLTAINYNRALRETFKQ